MNPVAAQQVALDNALVTLEKRLNIVKCNARIKFNKLQREEPYKVTLDALKLSPCYPTFLITAEVPEIYMHQFWNTIKKIRDTDAYQFKLDKQKCQIDTVGILDLMRQNKYKSKTKGLKSSFKNSTMSHIVEDFVKRLKSTLGEEGNHYMEPAEFEIQKIVNILVLREAY
nr:hypothetical protein [Tanacetum cinerariifolium]